MHLIKKKTSMSTSVHILREFFFCILAVFYIMLETRFVNNKKMHLFEIVLFFIYIRNLAEFLWKQKKKIKFQEVSVAKTLTICI